MNRRKTFLFFALLILALLTQIIVFRWGAEAIFFVTWLLLALVVQHDSRLSASIGLIILVTCPFLLIFKKEAAAEGAANYAYFFLAIGVLVQLEELLLERFGWLARKVDFSYLWRPVTLSTSSRWKATLIALRRRLATGDWSDLVRLIQVLGTVGLAVVLLSVAFSGAQFVVVLPFLAGAILFPFIMWNLWWAFRSLRSDWLLRISLALVILPLAAMELLWLYNLTAAHYPARMAMAYDFISHLPDVQRTLPTPEGEDIEMRAWTISDSLQQVLYQHPAYSGASRIVFTVPIEKGERLTFDVATAPESWHLPGDGVTFAVYAESAGSAQQLFATYIDPKNNEADRRWHPISIDLSAYSGKTINLIFETGVGPAGDYRNDWAGWGSPRLMKP
jgi:hypothetical protein